MFHYWASRGRLPTRCIGALIRGTAMRVDVSGQQFVFPTTCACCSGTADTELIVSANKSSGKRVVRTSTNAWDIPYCRPCVSHVRAANTAVIVAWVLALFSVAVAALLAWAVSSFLGVPVGVTGLGATALAYRN